MKYQERLHLNSKVKWTSEEIKNIEKEEKFKVLEYNLIGIKENSEYVYDALVEWEFTQ
ncbi:hypothetical protein [Petroclostridium sp. X23]|uniref:hypothetical protein n=1 Tax=Petroclostridium sp. X23 TaxID=3045146 RepID=UPI0024AD8D25|nr:hypothetical protein [Petroclostridium sp. X23]WHH58460.1 hypothetical protein QKW49_22105 [Petroclostridium sp. X23]